MERNCKERVAKLLIFGGASRDRTDDLIVANDALSRISPVLNQSLPVRFATINLTFLEREWNVRMLEFASRTQQESSQQKWRRYQCLPVNE